MANFTISIGPLTSAPVAVDSAKALAVVQSYLELQGAITPDNNQARLDALAIEIAKHIKQSANQWNRIRAAQQAEQSTPEATWE